MGPNVECPPGISGFRPSDKGYLLIGRCSEKNYNQVPRAGEAASQNISWAVDSFNPPCELTCGCYVGQCPDFQPPGHEICAICGPRMAAPRTVYFFVEGGPPPPPPPPDLFHYILDVAENTYIDRDLLLVRFPSGVEALVLILGRTPPCT